MTSDNPFTPPVADLDVAPTARAGSLVPGGRLLPVGYGWRWTRESLLMTASAPLTWLLITLTFIAIGAAISVVPLVSLLWNVAVPIALGGIMLGCRALDQGQPLQLQHLFGCARQPYVQPLAMVGVLYLAGSIIAIVTVVAIGGIAAVAAIAVVGAEQAEAQPLLVGAGVVVLALLVLLVTMALAMTLWFSPALVALHQVQPLDAMRLSLRGAARNVGPFLVYGLALFGVVLLSGLVGGGFALAGGRLMAPGLIGVSHAVIVATAVAVLSLLALAPTVWCAMYASYRDVFVA